MSFITSIWNWISRVFQKISPISSIKYLIQNGVNFEILSLKSENRYIKLNIHQINGLKYLISNATFLENYTDKVRNKYFLYVIEKNKKLTILNVGKNFICYDMKQDKAGIRFLFNEEQDPIYEFCEDIVKD